MDSNFNIVVKNARGESYGSRDDTAAESNIDAFNNGRVWKQMVKVANVAHESGVTADVYVKMNFVERILHRMGVQTGSMRKKIDKAKTSVPAEVAKRLPRPYEAKTAQIGQQAFRHSPLKSGSIDVFDAQSMGYNPPRGFTKVGVIKAALGKDAFEGSKDWSESDKAKLLRDLDHDALKFKENHLSGGQSVLTFSKAALGDKRPRELLRYLVLRGDISSFSEKVRESGIAGDPKKVVFTINGRAGDGEVFDMERAKELSEK